MWIIIMISLVSIYVLLNLVTRINWFKGQFIHKKCKLKNTQSQTYLGMFVTGYKCSKCGYEYSIKNKKRPEK